MQGTAQQEGSIASFMSPYQQDVIDASLTALQREQDKGLMSLRDSAVRSGAFGGGREAAAIGEFEATGAAARATLESQLRQQAFQDAVARRNQDLAKQTRIRNFPNSIRSTTTTNRSSKTGSRSRSG